MSRFLAIADVDETRVHQPGEVALDEPDPHGAARGIVGTLGGPEHLLGNRGAIRFVSDHIVGDHCLRTRLGIPIAADAAIGPPTPVQLASSNPSAS
jgi:hypothetical protein